MVRRALPHGHVAAVPRHAARHRSRSSAWACWQPLPRPRHCDDCGAAAHRPASLKTFATARMLDPLTAAFSLGEALGLGAVDEDELYVALDWLGSAAAVETALARKHLRAGTLVLYDVSSSYVEGRCCESAATTATARRASCRSSTACCARPTDARSRSRFSRATPPIRARSPRRSTRSN